MMRKLQLSILVLTALAFGITPTVLAAPAPPAPALDCHAQADQAPLDLAVLANPEAQSMDNRPFGPIGPPPATPGNACEAQCVADYYQCQRICSRNPCLVSCSFLYDNCVASC